MADGRSRSRPRLVLVALALGLAVIAGMAISRLTAGPDVPTFRVDFPQGEIERPLTVTVRDHALVVAAVDGIPALPDGQDPSSNVGSTPTSGEARQFSLWWLGGACERDTTVRLTSATDGIHVDIRTERGLFGSCPAVGIYRYLSIRTVTPLDLSEIGISYEPG